MAALSSTVLGPQQPSFSLVGGVSFKAPRLPSAAVFDASKHLSYTCCPKQHAFGDLGLEEAGISRVAVTDPFPLFSKEGIVEMRRDILSDKVMKDYRVTSYMAKLQAREYSPKVAPFTLAAWSSAEVTRAVSEAAGIELVPIMTLELGHTNFQVEGDDPSILSDEPSRPYGPLTPEQAQALTDRDPSKATVALHYDSYPFVCVAMLSDVSNMVGGETAVVTGDGSLRYIRGPNIGDAVVMQGRHVKHLAAAAFNAPERITMVTSYRAKDPLVRDASNLSTIHIISKQDRLNYQWSLYRMKLLAERFAKYAELLESKRNACEEEAIPEIITKAEMETFAQEQMRYLAVTYEEME